MDNKVKLQHYVPKVYLKNFSIENKGKFYLKCFDKQTEEVFPVNIEKIAYDKEFYDSLDENQITEKFLKDIETEFGKAISDLIVKKNLDNLDRDKLESIAKFVSIQMLRTKETRLIFKQASEQFLEKFKEKLSNKLRKEVEDSMKKENLRKTHRKLILEDYETFEDIIKKMKWILIENKSKFPFWTSDNPVVKYNSFNHFPYGNLGLTKLGIEIHFPLNPKLCLIICDPVSFSLEPNRKITNDYRHVIRERDLQVRDSTRFVFSRDENFNFAKTMLKKNPSLKNHNRKRIKVN